MKKLILSISIVGLMLVGCSDDDNPAASTVTFTEGTYNMTSGTMYDNADCSGVGISGECMTDEDAMTEATCPSGVCAVGFENVEAADQAACTTAGGAWMTGICWDGTTNQSACTEACTDDATGSVIVAVDEDACDVADGYWMGWTNLGWTDYAEDSDFSFTFGANGVFTDSDGEGGTYTVDGTTITVVGTDCCYDSATDDCTDATTETACTGDGEWEEAETHTATLDAAAGTISLSDANEECHDGVNTTEATCTEDYWESMCATMVFTLSAD